MALHDYAVETIGSKSTLRVLKTLIRYKGKIFTVRELARTTDISHPEVSRVLKELEKKGVVNLQRVGNAYLVSLNDESYILNSIVKPIFKAEENTLNSIMSAIKPFFTDTRIYSAAIFGSVAKQIENQTSDIDLLVISDDKEFAINCVSMASELTITKFRFPISPLIMSKARFIRDSDSELIKSILESYVTVQGKDLKKVAMKYGKVSR